MRARYVATGLLALEPRAFGIEFEVTGQVAPRADLFEEIGPVAVISIDGPLEQHPSWFFDDYESIHARAVAAFASSSSFVALKINSPGGAAAGCFELARALRTMALESGKPLGVFVDGMAASAAYAIACGATAGIAAPPTSTVASLAVYEMLVDQTSADAAMGVRFLFVPSTGADLKLTGNAHVAPSDVMVQHTQAQVDLLTSYFYGLVEEMRGVPQSAIRALRGATLLASQGVESGLVDVLLDWEGFLARLQTPEGIPMQTQAKAAKSSPLSDAITSLMNAAENGDEEEKSKARKLLATHFAEDEEEDPEKKKKEEDEPEAAASDLPKKEEPAAAAGAELPPKKEDDAAAAAQARAAASAGSDLTVSLAKQLQTLLAERAQEKDAAARAALLAQRPDFSAEIRKTLATAPLATLEQAVKSWPRVTATAESAIAAAMPGTTPGKFDTASHGALSADERAVLDRWNGPPAVTQARVEGTSLVLDQMTPAAAARRLAEMVEQGLTPGGAPPDFARVSQTEFRVAGKK